MPLAAQTAAASLCQVRGPAEVGSQGGGREGTATGLIGSVEYGCVCVF